MNDHALTQQHFVAATKRKHQAAIFKTDERPIPWKTTDENLKKVLYFSGQISCRVPVKFFFLSPDEFFSNIHKHVTVLLTQQHFVFI